MGKDFVVDAEISYHVSVEANSREEAEKKARKWIKKNLLVIMYPTTHRSVIDVENGNAYQLYTVETNPKPVEDEHGIYGFTFRTDAL